MEKFLVVLVVVCAFLAALARFCPKSLRLKLSWLYKDVRRLGTKPGADAHVVARIDATALRRTAKKAHPSSDIAP